MNHDKINDVEKKEKKELMLDLNCWVNHDNKLVFDYSKEVLNKTISNSDKRVYYGIKENSQKLVNTKDQTELLQMHNLLFLARKSIKGYYELIWPIVKFDSLDTDNLDNLDYKMWLSIKTEEEKKENNDDNNNNPKKSLYENENEDYYLSENDIIKFGKTKYEVIKLNIVSNNEKKNESKKLNLIEQISEDNKNFGSVFYYPEKSKKIGKTLALCECEDGNNLKPKKKPENSDGPIISYKWENFNCEKCFQPYSIKYKNLTDNKIYSFVDGLDISKETNYMILESLTHFTPDDNKMKKNKKNIFVINLDKIKEIKIGRSDNNDIIMENYSISGEHAILKFDEKEGKVMIKNKGRYGTSVLIKNNIKLESGQKIYFQVANTYIKAEVKEEIIEKNDKIH